MCHPEIKVGQVLSPGAFACQLLVFDFLKLASGLNLARFEPN
jgi:hypothetical protein